MQLRVQALRPRHYLSTCISQVQIYGISSAPTIQRDKTLQIQALHYCIHLIPPQKSKQKACPSIYGACPSDSGPLSSDSLSSPGTGRQLRWLQYHAITTGYTKSQTRQ